MMSDLAISPNFTIDDIHKVRRAIHEETKNMTPREIIEYTRREAQPILERLEKLKLEKSAGIVTS